MISFNVKYYIYLIFKNDLKILWELKKIRYVSWFVVCGLLCYLNYFSIKVDFDF